MAKIGLGSLKMALGSNRELEAVLSRCI